MPSEQIVVVGGGLAAARLASEYREAGGEKDLVVLGAEPDPPYNRPPLTKGYLRGEVGREDTFVQALEDWEEAVVELRLETTVEAIHPGESEVELRGGERVEYGTLVVATGARPRQLTIPGADLVGVHTYRTLADADAVGGAVEEAHSAIVIGGSFIGAEAAASLRARGVDVTLIEQGPTLMPQLGCPELSAELAELYREQGVEVLLETAVEELTGNGRLLTGARLADGRTVEGYLAVVGIGVEPNVELAEAAGAEVDDGIVVDERFRSSLDDVYAIGDVARYPDQASRRLRRVEHWGNASEQGKHLGRQLAGARARYDQLPIFFTQLFDWQLKVVGDVQAAAECVLRGSIADGRLIGFHLNEKHELVAAVVHGHAADVFAEIGELIRQRPTVADPARLLDKNLRPAEAVAD